MELRKKKKDRSKAEEWGKNTYPLAHLQYLGSNEIFCWSDPFKFAFLKIKIKFGKGREKGENGKQKAKTEVEEKRKGGGNTV